MMMKNLFNFDFVIGIGFILYWLIATATHVGKLPNIDNEPYSITIIFTVGLVAIPPFVLGWLAGNKYRILEDMDD